MLTDESSSYTVPNRDAIEADLKSYYKDINCLGIEPRLSILVSYAAGTTDGTEAIFYQGWDYTKLNLDVPENMVVDFARTEPVTPNVRYQPSDIVDFVTPLVTEDIERIVYVVDNSGSITFDQIKTEMNEATDNLRSLGVKQTIAYGAENYFLDFATVCRGISSGDFIKNLPSDFWN